MRAGTPAPWRREGAVPDRCAVRGSALVNAQVANDTIDAARRLQRALYRAAKARPERRLHALDDKVHREDSLQRAWGEVVANGGAAGVDEQTIGDRGAAQPAVAGVGCLLPRRQRRTGVPAPRRGRPRAPSPLPPEEGRAVRAMLDGPHGSLLPRAGRPPPPWNRGLGTGHADNGAVNGRGKPCAGEPHARFDEGRLETGHGRFGTASARNGHALKRTTPAPVSYSTWLHFRLAYGRLRYRPRVPFPKIGRASCRERV